MSDDHARRPPATLEELIADTLDKPVPHPVRLLAEEARKRHQRGKGVAAVLAYGSTLREASPEESLVDLYVLTFDSEAVSDIPLSRLGCRLLPPNVYYLETQEENGQGLHTWRAKYACLTLQGFASRMQANVRNPYFWARFSQPSRLVWAHDEAVRQEVIAALTTAVRTMLTFAHRLTPKDTSCQNLWQEALVATYASELRVEGPERARLIVSRNRKFMTAACALFQKEAARMPPLPPLSTTALRIMQIEGKALSVLRLAKAAFTFAGGADYIAWKIARHTGEKIELTPFERRHPLFAALRHLPRLLRHGTVR